MVLDVVEGSRLITRRAIEMRVCGVVGEVAEVGSGVEVSPSSVISHFAGCSIARVSLQLAVERNFRLPINSFPLFELVPGQTTVRDLTHFAWVMIAKKYSDDDLCRLIALCFKRLGDFTDAMIEGLAVTSRPIVDSLGPLDELDWSEWRLEMRMFLPVRIPVGFCRQTPIEIWYFLRTEIDALI